MLRDSRRITRTCMPDTCVPCRMRGGCSPSNTSPFQTLELRHMSAAEEEIREVTAAPDQALIQAISKAELDQAITTARAFPRSVKEFMDECMQLATLNTEIADDCIYALPRREKDKATGKWVTKNIEGPSAR